MAAGTIAPTSPYCRACGWDFIQSPNLDDDQFCDACGDDLVASIGSVPFLPPSGFTAVGGSLAVTFTWIANVDADSTDFRHQTDGGAWTTVIGDTSTTVVVAAEGEEVCGQLRSVTDGVNGAWTASSCDTATA